MRWLHKLRIRLASLRRSRAAADLDAELRFHLDQQIAENLSAGMEPGQARRAAMQSFGSVTAVRDETHATWSWTAVELFFRDIGLALRSLSRAPGFTSTAVLVIALSLGANIAIFAVIRSVLLKPLPFHDPSRVIVLYQSQQNGHDINLPIDAGSFWDWQRAAGDSAELALVTPFEAFNLSTRGELPEKVGAGLVSWNFFHLLGVPPALGRTFTPADDRAGAPATVVLMHSLWRRRFNADPAIIGTEIWLDARPYTVIGVMPSWFRYEGGMAGNKDQVWVPIRHEASARLMDTYEDHEFLALGRLAPGKTASALYEQLSTVQRGIKAAHPGPAVRDGVMGHTLLDDAVADYRTPLLTIFAATGCVLLIACLNVGSLLVARTAARRKELAIRTALGAGRARLLREQLLESVLLFGGGGLVGLLLARALIAWLIHARQDMNRIDGIHIDLAVVLFAALAIVLCSLLSGAISAWSINSTSLLTPLQDSSRGSTAGQARTGLRRALLAAQVGLTVVLLFGAGLLLKSYLHLRTTDVGIPSDNVLTMHFSLPEARYQKPEAKAAFMEELLRGVRALPGVTTAGLVSTAPGQGWGGDDLTSIPEHPPLPKGSGIDFMVRAADPGYFQAAGLPILRGRTFASNERLDHAKVVLISKRAAMRYFPNEDPIGKHVRFDYSGEAFEIVGIVGDARWLVSQPDNPTLYMPLLGNDRSSATLLVRSAHDVEALSNPIQRLVNTLDPDLPVSDVETLDETMKRSALGSQFNSLVIAGFAVIALCLAAAGLYGVLAYFVAQRTSELGVRIALGAQRAQILRLVLFDGLRPALLGLLFGLAGSVTVARFIGSLLYGTQPYDATIFVAVSAILLLVAAFACTIPAWRASRLNPLLALRVP